MDHSLWCLRGEWVFCAGPRWEGSYPRWGRTQEPVWLVCSGRNDGQTGRVGQGQSEAFGDPVHQQLVGIHIKYLLCEEGLAGGLLCSLRETVSKWTRWSSHSMLPWRNI